jgi:hypothetical protein
VLLGPEEQRLSEMRARLGFANELPDTSRPGASEQVESAAALLGAASLFSDNTHAPPDDGVAGGPVRPFFDEFNAGGSPRAGGSGTPVGGGAPTSFFDNLGAAAAATPTAASGRSGASAAIGQTLSIGDSGALEAEAEGETELQRNLFVGNHAAAVATCFAHDRLADALVVAHVSNSQELWLKTLARYTELCPQPYLRVVEVRSPAAAATAARRSPWRHTSPRPCAAGADAQQVRVPDQGAPCWPLGRDGGHPADVCASPGLQAAVHQACQASGRVRHGACALLLPRLQPHAVRAHSRRHAYSATRPRSATSAARTWTLR